MASAPRGDDEAVTTYFSGLAETYAAHRPSYAPAAVTWILDGLAANVRVADIGCGTGIFARLLTNAGCRVVGIEPDDDMRSLAARGSAPRIDLRRGRAEATGLADATVDLVTCAQAFHWFDPERALPEFHRILAARGRLALLWNVRDANSPFTTAYDEIMTRAQDDAALRGRIVPRRRTGRPDGTGHFINARTWSFDNPHRMDWTSLLGRAHSASYFPRDRALRRHLEESLRSSFDRHAEGGTVVLEQRTEVTIADRAPALTTGGGSCTAPHPHTPRR